MKIKNDGFIPTPTDRCDLQEQGGFIALISVIIITLVLITVITGLATKGFLDRFNIIDGENKEISAGLASACVESARIKIARDGITYLGNEALLISVSKDEDGNITGYNRCEIFDVDHVGGESTFTVRGLYSNPRTSYEECSLAGGDKPCASTKYEVVIPTNNAASTTSWREI